jgi:hypothetical protein
VKERVGTAAAIAAFAAFANAAAATCRSCCLRIEPIHITYPYYVMLYHITKQKK